MQQTLYTNLHPSYPSQRNSLLWCPYDHQASSRWDSPIFLLQRSKWSCPCFQQQSTWLSAKESESVTGYTVVKYSPRIVCSVLYSKQITRYHGKPVCKNGQTQNMWFIIIGLKKERSINHTVTKWLLWGSIHTSEQRI